MKLPSIKFVVHYAFYMIVLVAAVDYCSVSINQKIDVGVVYFGLLLVTLLLVDYAKKPLSQFVIVSWQWWMVIGVLNISTSVKLYGADIRGVEDAMLIYQIYLFIFSASIVFFENIFSASKVGKCDLEKTSVTAEWGWLLILFPFLMFIEVYLKLGFIPVLAGENIVGEMYEYDYGFLYSYKGIMLFSMIIVFHKLLKSKFSSGKILWFCTLLLMLAISLMESKRIIFLCSMIMVLVYLYKVKGMQFIVKWGGWYGLAALALYVFMASVRSAEGVFARGSGWDHVFYMVGVEFKDFAWTVTHFVPGGIKDYSWFVSSIASFVNGNVLSLFGFNKGELTVLDSAHTWSALFGIDLGIRTGIISELWFGYGYAGLLIMGCFGLYTTWLVDRIDSVREAEPLFLYLYLYSFVVLLIMGQSSMFFGVLITGIYVHVALWLIKYFRIKGRM